MRLGQAAEAPELRSEHNDIRRRVDTPDRVPDRMGKVGPCARAWAAARCCCWQADCHRWSCGGASTPAGTAGSATTPEKEKDFSLNVCTSRKNYFLAFFSDQLAFFLLTRQIFYAIRYF